MARNPSSTVRKMNRTTSRTTSRTSGRSGGTKSSRGGMVVPILAAAGVLAAGAYAVYRYRTRAAGQESESNETSRRNTVIGNHSHRSTDRVSAMPERSTRL